MTLAGHIGARHTANMGALAARSTRRLVFLAVCALALPAAADEIRLKDGKKLYGTIVSYEDNMFKVKTDFGYVLVEKDKIAQIIPTAPPTPQPAKVEAKKEDAAKPQATPAAAREAAPGAASSATVAANKKEQAPKSTVAAATPAPTTAAGAPASKPAGQPNTGAAAASATPPAPAKDPEPPANREEVQGNTYINYTYGFRMYKPPGWNLLDDARQALPNAIVALGTSAESTLMVIGREETKDPLEKAAAGIERRLQEAYENYRRLEQKKVQVGGMPAMEYHYRGRAEDHDWSGILVVVARGSDVFTVLGMTYADSDLIQIQENVIARAVSSLSFSVH